MGDSINPILQTADVHEQLLVTHFRVSEHRTGLHTFDISGDFVPVQVKAMEDQGK